MEKNLKKVLKRAVYEPNSNLSEAIWHNIIKKEKFLIRFKVYAFSLLGFLSIAGIIPVAKSLFVEFTQSGFYEYFSLFFSSGSSLSFYWKELTLSMAESLPVLDIIFLFSLVFIFLFSLRYVFKQIINNNNIGLSYV